METPSEKPLLPIAGKPMINHVIEGLEESENIGRIVVATTPVTPNTAEVAKKLSLEVLITSGRSYVSDLREAVKKLGRQTVLVISADLPFVTAEILNEIAARFRQSNKPALSVFVPCEVFRRLGLTPGVKFEIGGRKVSPVGINVIEGENIDDPHIDQENAIFSRPELVLNVNDRDGLRLAREISSRGSQI